MWAEDKKKYVKFSTFSAYEVILTHHILPEFSGRTMLSEDDVQEFVLNKLRGGLSPKTVKDILMVLRMVAGFGERNGVLPGLGLPLAVAVHEANLHDSKGTPKVIERLAHKFPRLVKILADGGYQGDLADWMKKKFGWTLEVVLRPDECPSKFQVLPKRWIVERSFAWLDNFRRLTIDYEYLPDTAEAMVQLAFSKIIRKQPVNTVLI